MRNTDSINPIQQPVKRILPNDRATFIPGMQDGFNIQKSINAIHPISRIKKKNHTIIPMDTEKHLTKSSRKIYYQFFFMLKTPKTKDRGKLS